MNRDKTLQLSLVAKLQALHASGCFVIPNPWNAGSARFLEQLGFSALATTSAGLAFSLGKPDTVTAISRDVVLSHLREIVAATNLPVSADFQAGYADQLEQMAANVALCIETGIAGFSIEDASGDPQQPLYDLPLAIERIRVARAAIDASGVPVVLTARCEAWLVGHPHPLQEAQRRLQAFAEAGADCLFAPGVRDPQEIEALVQAVAPKPLNVLVSSPHPDLTVSRLAELGVHRISVGSALARVAWKAFMTASTAIVETGHFDALAPAASFAELNQLFT